MAEGTFKKIAFALAAGQDRIVKVREATVITGRSRTSIWRDEQAGRFPRKLRIGPNSTGYLLSELEAWLNSLQEATPKTAKSATQAPERNL